MSSRPVLRRACSALGVCIAYSRSQLHSQPERRGASELALFYRKGLIALPITDNATINDIGEKQEEWELAFVSSSNPKSMRE